MPCSLLHSVGFQADLVIFHPNLNPRNGMVEGIDNPLGNGILQFPLDGPAQFPGTVDQAEGLLHQVLP